VESLLGRHIATDSIYGEEESVARGWGVGRASYASGAGPVEITIECAPPTIKKHRYLEWPFGQSVVNVARTETRWTLSRKIEQGA